MKRGTMQFMDNYLIIQGARFGDLLQTARLIKSLQAFCKIHLALDTKLTVLADLAYPGISAIGLKLHGALTPDAMEYNEKAFKELSLVKFKRVYNCNFSPLTGAVGRLYPADMVDGYRPARDSSGGFLLSPWLRLIFRLSANRNANPLNLADIWGWFAKTPAAPELVNPVAQAGGHSLGITVAGQVERRSIPIGTLANLITIYDKIHKPDKIKLFGTSQEKGRARKLMELLGSSIVAKTINLCGKTDWPDLFREIKELALLITPDTGLMHLAARLGIPVMAVFLASALCHETAPYGAGHCVWQSLPPCGPCLETQACQHNHQCASIFDTPEFYRTATSWLQGETPASLPEGLQLWSTDFDALGLKLRLLAGADVHQAARNDNRAFLEEYLRLNYEILANTDLRQTLLHKLVTDDEWMLPPWRYC